MKHLKTLLLALAGTACLTSCEKNYNCVCKDSSGNTVSTNALGRMSKHKAKSNCDQLSTAYSASGTATCSVQ